jgi:hypothetical protein
MAMKEPKATVNLEKGRLTIYVEPGSFASSWFTEVASALKLRSIDRGICADCDEPQEDAHYLGIMADAIYKAVKEAEQKHQNQIANALFGGE